MSEKKGQNFLHGAAIYTVGIVIIKILGAVYKLPLGNILGDDGYSHFLCTYNIYNFFLTLSTAGLPVAMSRMIAEEAALEHEQQVKRIFRVGFGAFFVLGALCTAVMMIFPQQLAERVAEDIYAAEGLFVMGPAVLLVCITAAYRGYTQGHSDMIPTTISQVIETASKVLIGLTAAIILKKRGASISICVAGAILGTTVSSLICMIYMMIKAHRKYTINPPASETSDVPSSRRSILVDFIRIGIPLTISTAVMSLINLIDQNQVRSILMNALQYTQDKTDILYGVYGKATTLNCLPYAFVTPLMASIVPAISSARAAAREGEASDLAETSLRMTTLICLPMSVGLAVLCYPCMKVLYPTSADQGPLLLLILAIDSYFMVTTLMTNSILPANGNERLPVIAIVVGGVVKIAMNAVLIRIPSINIFGAPISSVCCYFVITAFNIFFINRKMSRPMNLWNILGRSGISAAVMGAAAWITWTVLHKLMGSMLIPFGIAVLVGVAVYVVLVVALHAITREDLMLIPKGEKIANLLHIQ